MRLASRDTRAGSGPGGWFLPDGTGAAVQTGFSAGQRAGSRCCPSGAGTESGLRVCQQSSSSGSVDTRNHARLSVYRPTEWDIYPSWYIAPHPRQIRDLVLQDVASCLAPDGVVLVTDCATTTRAGRLENCGDLWLGFNPQELARWAQEAGLTECQCTWPSTLWRFRSRCG